MNIPNKNLNDDTSISLALNRYENGLLNREEFWRIVNQGLHNVSRIHPLIRDKIESLRITRDALILKYKIDDKNLIDLQVPLDDLRTASLTILVNGVYEPFLEDLIFKLTEESESFYDIGANLGFYSNGAVARNSKIKCYSFEPNPGITHVLRSNVELNQNQGAIQIFEVALSDNNEIVDFFIPAFTGSGGGSLHDLHPEEGNAAKHQVLTRKLDEISAEISLPDLIKIDVEGAELGVLRGGMNVIKRSHPTIVIELLRKWMRSFGTTPQDVVTLLLNEGYECFAIQNDRILKINEISDSTLENNFLFLHSSRIEHCKSMAIFK